MYQWHREGFDLPRGVELLAEGDIFPIQAFRAGSGFAIQFHAEVTHAMMCRWTTRGAARMEMPGAKPRHEHFADRPVYDHGIRAWLSDFLDHWLAIGKPQQHLGGGGVGYAFSPSSRSARQSCGNSRVQISAMTSVPMPPTSTAGTAPIHDAIAPARNSPS